MEETDPSGEVNGTQKDGTANNDTATTTGISDGIDANSAPETEGAETKEPEGKQDAEPSPDTGTDATLTDPSNASDSNKSDSVVEDGSKESVPASRVIVSLGMKVDVPVGSEIKIGDQSFTVITREEAESKIVSANQLDK
ncbi:hypothetical protein D3C78_1463080 [compost metagenome]